MNTDKSKALLQQALQNMPQDFALSEVRFHLNSALQKLAHVEKKKVRREVVERQNTQRQIPLSTRDTLDAIDEMISQEKRKIQEIAEKKSKKPEETGDSFLNG